jgi:hypothetical protein
MRLKSVWVISMWVALLLPNASATPQSAAPRVPPVLGRTLALRVTGRDAHQPIAGVTITTEKPESEELATTVATDERGRCEVLVPKKALETGWFAMHAFKSGFVPVCVHWGSSAEADPIPEEYVLKLDPAVRIGGSVLSEEGKPVAGARLFPLLDARRSRKESITTTPGFFVETDEFGKWHCEIIPASWTSGNLNFRVEHPRFVSSGPGFDRILPIVDLRAERALLSLASGFVVTGTVKDPLGLPRAGALVTCSAWDVYAVEARTDPRGMFRFENLPPGQLEIMVEAAGFAPDVKTLRLGSTAKEAPEPVPLVPAPQPRVDFAAEPVHVVATQLEKNGECRPPLDFRLATGRTIRGRVVDHKGQPVTRAGVRPKLTRFLYRQPHWTSVTLADGAFQWTDAPLGDVVVEVVGTDESRAIEAKCNPTEDPVVIQLPVPFRVSGSVVDAETGAPINEFKLTHGMSFVVAREDNGKNTVVTLGEYPEQTLWQHRYATTHRNGRYESDFPTLALCPPDSYSVIIRADALDYESGFSRWFRESDGELVYNFKLKKRPWIRGSVLAPDGRPSAGAKVLLVQPGSPFPVVLNLSDTDEWQGERGVASPEGAFTFPRPNTQCLLLAYSAQGIAHRLVEGDARDCLLRLDAWGTANGRVLVGDHPAPRCPVEAAMDHATAPDGPSYQILFRSRTDESGYFSFGRVPPGPVSVYRPHRFSDGERVRSQATEIEVRRGASVDLTIGGSGRPLIGRLELARPIAGLSLAAIHGELVPMAAGGRGAKPDRPVSEPSAEPTVRSGRSATANATYAFDILADGHFRIEDVVEGRYSLKFTHDTHALEIQEDRTVAPAAGTRRVWSIALEMPEGDRSKPFDFGIVTIGLESERATRR